MRKHTHAQNIPLQSMTQTTIQAHTVGIVPYSEQLLLSNIGHVHCMSHVQPNQTP